MRSLLIVSLYILLAYQFVYGQQATPRLPEAPKPPVFDRDGASKKGDISSSIVGETGLELKTAQNLACDINISAHDDEKFEAHYQVWARAKSPDQEKRFIGGTQILYSGIACGRN